MSEAKDWAGELISGQTGTGRILVKYQSEFNLSKWWNNWSTVINLSTYNWITQQNQCFEVRHQYYTIPHETLVYIVFLGTQRQIHFALLFLKF